MTVAALLLAGGAGTRFEGDSHKLLAPLNGEPVVCHALRPVLAAGFNHIVVVTGAVDVGNDESVLAMLSSGPTVEFVFNPDWASGQASSLNLGIDSLRASSHSAVVVGLADQPNVGIAPWRTVGAARGPIVAASFSGKRRPPVKLDRSVWDLLPTTGDDGARALMAERPDLVSEVPCAGDPSDIDTVDDLAAIEASVSQ